MEDAVPILKGTHLIDRKSLLDDLKKLVTKLEKDLRERCDDNAEVDALVRVEYEKAREAKRTALAYKVWREEWLTQVAVAWVLGVVFVRFIEDNRLIPAPYVAGPNERLQFAKEQRTAFFQQNPTLSDREYLEHVFREVAKLPAMKELYDERHNPLWALGVSGDGAKLILEQFQKIDPRTGSLVHDFNDPELGTRFLGDLYQDLSEAARKKYALLQTPEFVEEFILDRTLDPAIAEFGLEAVRIIDPTCGSGHFLLGAFARLFRLWEERDAATNRIVLAQRALDAICGVDLNPYATAISRFRLLVASMRASGVKRLADCPDFRIKLATGDSLLHGAAGSGGATQSLFPFSPMAHVYETENKEQLEAILQVARYHVVVGNPPYITVKDAALNQAYRDRFSSCHRKYSLAVPFFERFFNLAKSNEEGAAGFVGMITANSFMKREFGKKLIESCLPLWDLTHVIDTSGAYIPGHGTPTVILFGRNQPPSSETIRTAMGNKGEPSTPEEPSKGQVWTAIRAQIDSAGSTSVFVSVSDLARKAFHQHPWSIGGSGAAELKLLLEYRASKVLSDFVESVGFAAILAEDEAFVVSRTRAAAAKTSQQSKRPLVTGEDVRDWSIRSEVDVLFPYTADIRLVPEGAISRVLWPFRTTLWNRPDFSRKSYREVGRPYWAYHQIPVARNRRALNLVFSNIATHNHFALVRQPMAFNSHAPLISLPDGSSEEDHLMLLAILNSSTACFWMKQVSHNKGATSDTGVLQADPEKFRFEFDGTKLSRLPLPALSLQQRAWLISLASAIDKRGALLSSGFSAVLESGVDNSPQLETVVLETVKKRERIREEMVWLQEELDWFCYELYGLLDVDSPAAAIKNVDLLNVGTLTPEERPFRQDTGRSDRRQMTLSDPLISVLEKPEYKRRWFRSAGAYDDTNLSDDILLTRALREWLANHLESPMYWVMPVVKTVSSLSQAAESIREFQVAAGFFRGTSAFDTAPLVADLVAGDSVPALPADRYKQAGRQKRELWEDVWAKQRREDEIDARAALPKSDPNWIPAGAVADRKRELVGDMPAPPKYASADFKSPTYWSLRGKLDVPKERFISFPGCERESDPSLPILWAGYDHLQQAKAIAAYYQDLKENEAAPPLKLGKLLACILELLPWLKQWHNEIDPEYSARMGDFFETFMYAEMAGLGLTMDDLRRIRGL